MSADVKARTFTIDISLTATLRVCDLWPDGDHPENPTVADVEELIDNDGGYEDIIRDWGIEHHLRGSVTDDAEFRARLKAAVKR